MSSFVFSDGNVNIYQNFTPAVKNFFQVEFWDYTTTSNTGSETPSNPSVAFDSQRMYNHSIYHAVSIKIDDEYLSLKRNNISKHFQVDGNESYVWANKLTIKWREDKDWHVRRYHENWISCIYDKEKDVYRASATGNPYRKIIITLPDGYQLVCEGVLPRNIGSIDLAWGKNGSIVEPQLDYYVTRVQSMQPPTSGGDE